MEFSGAIGVNGAAAAALAHALGREEVGQGHGLDVEDLFELANVSTELMVLQSSVEDKFFAQLGAGTKRLSPLVRQSALDLIKELMTLRGMPDGAWFKGAVLLDAWLAAHPAVTDSSFLGEIISLCLAVTQVIYKADATGQRDDPGRAQAEMEVLQVALQRSGLSLPVIGHRDVHTQEQSLLRCMGWRVFTPTLESWLVMLEKRFDMLTGGFYVEQKKWVEEAVRRLATVLVLWRPVGEPRRPLRLAQGLLGIGLVRARLLPIEGLRPQHVEADEWRQLFQESQQVADVPPCATDPCLAQWLLQSLATAANAPLEEVQQACEFTMGCLQGAYGDIGRELGPAAAP